MDTVNSAALRLKAIQKTNDLPLLNISKRPLFKLTQQINRMNHSFFAHFRTIATSSCRFLILHTAVFGKDRLGFHQPAEGQTNKFFITNANAASKQQLPYRISE